MSVAGHTGSSVWNICYGSVGSCLDIVAWSTSHLQTDSWLIVNHLLNASDRHLPDDEAFTEKKMFGGVGFLLNGNMCLGVWKTSLIARLGPEQAEPALNEPYVQEFDITGRPMKGWVMVEADGIESSEELSVWIQRSVDFVSTLPRK